MKRSRLESPGTGVFGSGGHLETNLWVSRTMSFGWTSWESQWNHGNLRSFQGSGYPFNNLNITSNNDTLQGTNISHLGNRKIIFKMPFLGDMLVPWRVVILVLISWIEKGNQPFHLKNPDIYKFLVFFFRDPMAVETNLNSINPGWQSRRV